ncbi:unnamed protein product (macronuclear) [Paramecium tetraurelia]|uniref:Transmembrane protein n=1 Tax=Paramecium tetraurelia TaxID=5888 RepID=A0E4X4_PARTE|nr:uncharacterized protein GSPATT00023517001 [Paramecium tetraurelia]CAK90341.1 unnamed protein product [Paramecium tetraurelia]|eukprot:XP_001457738.1 hypothetical protein (macronuclear) [Paramecium tetraurelia strain d4-2]
MLLFLFFFNQLFQNPSIIQSYQRLRIILQSTFHLFLSIQQLQFLHICDNQVNKSDLFSLVFFFQQSEKLFNNYIIFLPLFLYILNSPIFRSWILIYTIKIISFYDYYVKIYYYNIIIPNNNIVVVQQFLINFISERLPSTKQ